MTLPISASLAAKLLEAANDGLNVNWIIQAFFPAPVGTKYYACRAVTISGNAYAPKLLGAPGVPKRLDLSSLRMDALNDAVTLTLLNTPEDFDGETDAARIQTLMADVSVAMVLVKVGFCELDTLSGGEADVKWDGLYRIDRVDRTAHQVQFYCVDATLHPGEKMIGEPVADRDWPTAPESSYGQVRGPVFGKVDSLPLVPVETGLEANLAGEIDEQDGVIVLSGNLDLWPLTGLVQIEDEFVYYPIINKTTRVLGTTASKCTRGAGGTPTIPGNYLYTTPVVEIYSGIGGELGAALTPLQLTATVVCRNWPASGVFLIGSEYVRYASIAGSGLIWTLSGLTRGFAAPSLIKVHNAGSIVRTVPTVFRYVVAAGSVNAVTNVRVVDQAGNEAAYVGTATPSQVTTPSGRNVAVLALSLRPKIEGYEGSVSQVPPEWIVEGNGQLSSEGFMNAYLRWSAGPQMASNLAAQMQYVLDPSASGKFAVLKSNSADRIFNVIFDAGWTALNAPRPKYGRFKEARLRAKYQYDQLTEQSATFVIYKDGVLQKSGLLRPASGTAPTGGGTGNGTVSGTQVLRKESWLTQTQVRQIRLAPEGTVQFANNLQGEWINPFKTAANGNIKGTNELPALDDVIDGDRRTFLSGFWNYSVAQPNTTGGLSFTGPLYLLSRDVLPVGEATAKEKLVRIKLTHRKPLWAQATASNNLRDYWTGNEFRVTLRNAAGGVTHQYTVRFNYSNSTDVHVHTQTLPASFGWVNCQSIEVMAPQMYAIGSSIIGQTVGDLQVDIEYLPDVEGQRVNTTVDGGFFSVTGTPGGAIKIPSAVFEQAISIGNLAKTWGETTGNDPWEYFSGAGLDIQVFLQSSAGDVLFALADLEMELEYEAISVNFDVTVVADVDGRTGTPVGGGATVVLENPVDVLAYLVDQSEFFGMNVYRDSASFVTARALVNSQKVSRAVVSEITVRDLVASLCAECRMLPLFDAALYYVKYLAGEPTTSDSVGTFGDQADPAKALMLDNFPVSNRVEDIANSLGFSYRRNYRTSDFRAVMEVDDLASQATAVGRRRQTPQLDWHQSARGYAGGFAEQKGVVQGLAEYALSQSKVLWDYATIELSAAAAEALQRYDALILNRERSNYYNALGRVVATRRTDTKTWGVQVRMSPSTNGIYWQSVSTPTSYIRVAHNGGLFEFYILGVKCMEITAGGNVRAKGGIWMGYASNIVTSGAAGEVGTPNNPSIRYEPGSSFILFYRQRLSGVYAGQMEMLAKLRSDGVLIVHAYDDGSTITQRGKRGGAVMSGATGAAGIVDTGAGGTTGVLRFFLGNQVAAEFGDARLDARGSISASL